MNQHSFQLDKDFQSIVNKLVYQMQDKDAQESSQRRTKIIKDYARSGWDIPPGGEHEALDNLLIDSIRSRGNIVWKALKQTLKAFDPPFHNELATQLYSLADSFFPLSLCEPHDYLSRAGWERPNEEEAKQQLRYQLESARISSLNTLKTKIDLYMAKKKSQSFTIEHSPLKSETQKEYDVFICHASENKNDFVNPLVEALKQKNIDVWYDKDCIEWGKSIRQTIDKGLISCKIGIVVFSHAFFKKEWPQNELDALHQRMITGEVRILPIWHELNEEDLRKYSPLFSGLLAKSSDIGIEALTTEIEAKLHKVI